MPENPVDFTFTVRLRCVLPYGESVRDAEALIASRLRDALRGLWPMIQVLNADVGTPEVAGDA